MLSSILKNQYKQDMGLVFMPFLMISLILGLVAALGSETTSLGKVALKGIEGLFNPYATLLFFIASIVFTGVFLSVWAIAGAERAGKIEGVHEFFSKSLAVFSVSQMAAALGLLIPLILVGGGLEGMLLVVGMNIISYVIALTNIAARYFYFSNDSKLHAVGWFVGPLFVFIGIVGGAFLPDWRGLAY